MNDIIIVGAGVAGLSAAVHLAEAGYAVTVLEAKHRVGGRIRSVEKPQTSWRRQAQSSYTAFYPTPSSGCAKKTWSTTKWTAKTSFTGTRTIFTHSKSAAKNLLEIHPVVN